MIPLEVSKEDGMVVLRIGLGGQTSLSMPMTPLAAKELGQLLMTAGMVLLDELDGHDETLTEPHVDGDPYAATLRRIVDRGEAAS